MKKFIYIDKMTFTEKALLLRLRQAAKSFEDACAFKTTY